MFIKNVQRWLLPYLRRCEKRHPGSFYSLLREYLVALAADDLTLPVLLFKASKADVSSRILVTFLGSEFSYQKNLVNKITVNEKSELRQRALLYGIK